MSEGRTVLSDRSEDREELKREVDGMLGAVLSSFSDNEAFSGIDPNELRKRIGAIDILPEKGLGFDGALCLLSSQVLPHMLRTWSPSYMPHLHSPALIESVASSLAETVYNNSMDSWDQSPVATEIEVAVVRTLCHLFGYAEGSDGVFTSGGSQSNFSAIAAARDSWCRKNLGLDVKKNGNPDAFHRLRLYTSSISHFSMEKTCHMLGLGYNAVVKLPVDEKCTIDIAKAEEIIEKDVADGLLPFCIVATIGTTDFGSVDDIASLRRLADRFSCHLHADAAYGSGAVMSEGARKRIGNLSLADSITVDFHKMFLLPISCSCLLVKDASILDCFELHADYLNREEDEEDGYINLVGKGMQTTRSADALKVFFSFLTRGREGYGKIIDKVIHNASYLYKRLISDPSFICPVEPVLSSVVFALQDGDEVNRRVRRILLSRGTVIGQTVYNGRVMLKATLLNPALDEEHMETLIQTIKSIRDSIVGSDDKEAHN